jgi:23S rRNA (pseudouridine1915-N3)-methyltransferase
MQICLLFFGKPRPAEVAAGIDLYLARIRKLVDCEIVYLRGERIDRRTAEQVQEAEGKRALASIRDDDWLAVCDERGKAIDTKSMADIVEQAFNAGPRFAGKRRMVIAVGGALGFSSEVRRRADAVWSLSGLTLAESVARTVLAEGLYRAITVVRGHPYHNE